MTTLNLYYNIKEAYETSTLNNNRFSEFLNSIKWDAIFTADGEHYYQLGGFTFTTPSLDPFNMEWEPSAFFEDGCVLSF